VRAFFFYGIKRAYIRRASSRVSTLAGFPQRANLPLRELCGPKVGVSGDGALGPLPGGWGRDPAKFRIGAPLNCDLCRMSQCARD
jgi:hypothetical protein